MNCLSSVSFFISPLSTLIFLELLKHQFFNACAKALIMHHQYCLYYCWTTSRECVEWSPQSRACVAGPWQCWWNSIKAFFL